MMAQEIKEEQETICGEVKRIEDEKEAAFFDSIRLKVRIRAPPLPHARARLSHASPRGLTPAPPRIVLPASARTGLSAGAPQAGSSSA